MKKIYILVMVLLVYAASAFAASAAGTDDFVRITGNEKDVAATGEYDGMRKLENHKYAALYNFYFTADYNNNIEHMNYKTEYIGNNLQEICTFYNNGKAYSGTRSWWYKVLRNFPMDTREHNAFKALVGEEFYNDWLLDEEATIEGSKMIEEYIEKIYLPRLYPNYKRYDGSDRFSTADIKIVPEKPKKKIFGLF